MDEKIFDPLEMSDTFFNVPNQKKTGVPQMLAMMNQAM